MDDMFSKIFSIVDMEKIDSKEEFDIFLENLINHPAPLREACAYKLNEVFKDDFIDNTSSEILLKAVIDINPNVSRCICSLIEKSSLLQELLKYKIIANINEILNKIPDIEKLQNNKNHKKNKLLFSLYWLLEALYYCIKPDESTEVVTILQKTVEFSDYTIREKTAKIISKLSAPPANLLEIVNNDKNFYVNFYTNLYKN